MIETIARKRITIAFSTTLILIALNETVIVNNADSNNFSITFTVSTLGINKIS